MFWFGFKFRFMPGSIQSNWSTEEMISKTSRKWSDSQKFLSYFHYLFLFIDFHTKVGKEQFETQSMRFSLRLYLPPEFVSLHPVSKKRFWLCDLTVLRETNKLEAISSLLRPLAIRSRISNSRLLSCNSEIKAELRTRFSGFATATSFFHNHRFNLCLKVSKQAIFPEQWKITAMNPTYNSKEWSKMIYRSSSHFSKTSIS